MIFVNNFDPILIDFGAMNIRWYGLMFLAGVVLNYLYTRWVFLREGEKAETLDSVIFYMFIGLVVGARLGHVFFYEASYYLANPGEILKIWNGGLASHGAAIGVLVAYLLWIWVHKVRFSKYINMLVLAMPLTAMFVRIGNFFNSEIVGTFSGDSYGVVFRRLGEHVPRHPAQLYEGILCLLIFVAMFLMYRKWGMGKARGRRGVSGLPRYFYVFFFVGVYFSGRFLIEFVKDLPGHEWDIWISMGQILSIVPVGLAVGYFVRWLLRR
jgi:phosphatidylglycerol---prolipoprotein diacylglyceryl transferase